MNHNSFRFGRARSSSLVSSAARERACNCSTRPTRVLKGHCVAVWLLPTSREPVDSDRWDTIKRSRNHHAKCGTTHRSRRAYEQCKATCRAWSAIACRRPDSCRKSHWTIRTRTPEMPIHCFLSLANPMSRPASTDTSTPCATEECYPGTQFKRM